MIPPAMKTAAQRIDPARPPEAWHPGNEEEVSAVVEVLRANKVPLADLDPGAGPAGGSRVWSEALEREREERAGLLERYKRVESMMRSEGIEPVLFKSARGLPYRSSNLDLLVSADQMDRAAELLAGDGHLAFPHYREEHKLLFRKFEQGRSTICVHLHETVSWGRVVILGGDEVCRDSRAGEDCRVASPVHLVLATLAHILYETDQIRLSDLRTLRICSRDPGMDWSAAAAGARGRHWEIGYQAILGIVADLDASLFGIPGFPEEPVEQARAAVRESGWAARYPARIAAAVSPGGPGLLPMPLSKVHSKIHYLRQLLIEPERSPDERLADVVATAWNLVANRLGLRCRPAVIVSLSGLDGAGKSTAIQAAEEAMRLCEIPLRVVWSRGGFTQLGERLKGASRQVLPGHVPGAGDQEGKRRWLARFPGQMIFSALVAIEQALHYQVRVRIPRWLGFSILCDRYTFDTEADLRSKLGRDSAPGRAAAVLIRWLAPRPDLAIHLHLSAGEARRRKPEETDAGELEARQDSMMALAARDNLLVIDAARPRTDVAGLVVEASLRAAFERFSRQGRRARL